MRKGVLKGGLSRVTPFRVLPSPRLLCEGASSLAGVRLRFSFALYPGRTNVATALCCVFLLSHTGSLFCSRFRAGITAVVALRLRWSELGSKSRHTKGARVARTICSSWGALLRRRLWVFRSKTCRRAGAC